MKDITSCENRYVRYISFDDNGYKEEAIGRTGIMTKVHVINDYSVLNGVHAN